MDMQQVNPNPSGQAGNPDQNKKAEEKKKLDEDLKQGKITQAEYFKKMQELGISPNPPAGAGSGQMPTSAPQQAPPRLPPVQPSAGGIKPITPITPLTPQQAGPREEIPPIGQALAVSSEDVEVVECYKCGGLITVTTPQRPVIIACPTCGTKGEVDSGELEVPEDTVTKAPRASDGIEIDDKKIFKFDGEDGKPKGPQFGATLDDDLKKQETSDKQNSDQQSSSPSQVPVRTPTPAPKPANAPTPAPKPKNTEDKND
jgi:hypothetical protein